MKNPDMLDALIGIYERNVQGYPSTAVLPYSQALSRFPAHLQQCDMESNGKTVNRFGEPVNYVTGPVIFGEPGTNGQHSFYQLLHQGSDIVPLQFIGFKNSQLGVDVDIENSTSQQKLCANVAAQIVAFACGKEDENLNKNFKGKRPSSIIIGQQLTPASLGALLAHFENKIMFQGFVWNLNSFDQEGVQLGKVLAKRVLAHNTDGALKVFSDLLNLRQPGKYRAAVFFATYYKNRPQKSCIFIILCDLISILTCLAKNLFQTINILTLRQPARPRFSLFPGLCQAFLLHRCSYFSSFQHHYPRNRFQHHLQSFSPESSFPDSVPCHTSNWSLQAHPDLFPAVLYPYTR